MFPLKLISGVGMLLLLTISEPCRAQTAPPELTSLQQQYDKLTGERVTSIYEAGLTELNSSYLASLNRSMADAKARGQLPLVLALDEEVKRIAARESIPADTPQTPETLKNLRVSYRAQVARLDAQRASNTLTLLTPYAARLKQLEAALTKADRIADAKAVMDHREKLLAMSKVAPNEATPGGPAGTFTNSLGMKFVPVPGTQILICIHETRRQDYEAFAAAAPGVNDTWKSLSKDGLAAGAEGNHPVVGVSWADASAFCEWLSQKEGREYRLPTDREWSFAVGIGRDEKKDASPDALNGKTSNEWPWGKKWPPKDAVGNYADAALKERARSRNTIDGYSDGFAATSPVMSFPSNKLGIYDLGGNVWEWCADWYSPAKVDRVTRGGSWQNFEPGRLLSSARDHTPPDRRAAAFGFRCVASATKR